MAITMNALTKQGIESGIVGMANEIERIVLSWERFYQWTTGVLDADLLAVGLTADDVAYWRSAALGFHNMYLAYKNQAKIGTDDPSYFIGKFSQQKVF